MMPKKPTYLQKKLFEQTEQHEQRINQFQSQITFTLPQALKLIDLGDLHLTLPKYDTTYQKYLKCARKALELKEKLYELKRTEEGCHYTDNLGQFVGLWVEHYESLGGILEQHYQFWEDVSGEMPKRRAQKLYKSNIKKYYGIEAVKRKFGVKGTKRIISKRPKNIKSQSVEKWIQQGILQF